MVTVDSMPSLSVFLARINYFFIDPLYYPMGYAAVGISEISILLKKDDRNMLVLAV